MDPFDHTLEPPWPEEVQPESWRLTLAANAACKAAKAAVEMAAAAEEAWLVRNDDYCYDAAEWATEATQAARQCRDAVAEAAALLDARKDWRQRVADYRNQDVGELQWDDENDQTEQTVLTLTWRAGKLAIAAYRACFQAATEVAAAVLDPHGVLDRVSCAFDILGANAPDEEPRISNGYYAAAEEAKRSVAVAIGFLQDAAELARKTRDDEPRADFMRAVDALEFAITWLGKRENSDSTDF